VFLGLVNEAVESHADGAADEGAVGHKLAVDPVEDGLQVVAFSRVLAVEELDQGRAEAGKGGGKGGGEEQLDHCPNGETLCTRSLSLPPSLPTAGRRISWRAWRSPRRRR
jgi:hypothetical protein